MRLWMYAMPSLLAAACVGETAGSDAVDGGASDAASDASSITPTWSAVCPASEPAQGSACSADEIDCEYGCGKCSHVRGWNVGRCITFRIDWAVRRGCESRELSSVAIRDHAGRELLERKVRVRDWFLRMRLTTRSDARRRKHVELWSAGRMSGVAAARRQHVHD